MRTFNEYLDPRLKWKLKSCGLQSFMSCQAQLYGFDIQSYLHPTHVKIEGYGYNCVQTNYIPVLGTV